MLSLSWPTHSHCPARYINDLKKLLCKILAGLVILFSGFCTSALSQDDTRSTEDIEAAMIFVASKFITWPLPISDHFDVCVENKGRLAQTLHEYTGKHLKSAEVRIHVLKNEEFPMECRIIVFSDSSEHIKKRLAILKNRPVMTISDSPGFVDTGGIMEFLLIDGKVRFKINLEAAQAAGITLGSQMVGLATFVKRVK